MKNINAAFISGTVIRSERKTTNSGKGFWEGRVKVHEPGWNDRPGKDHVIELTCWMDDMPDIGEGESIVAQGKLTGQENDRGFVNVRMVANAIEVNGSGAPASKRDAVADSFSDDQVPF